MAATPKNKITRVEQGKRRAGNTPKLLRDTKVSRIPLHKRGLFERLLQKSGTTATTKASASKKKAKTTSMANPAAQSIAPTVSSKVSAPKVRRTQQKGAG